MSPITRSKASSVFLDRECPQACVFILFSFLFQAFNPPRIREVLKILILSRLIGAFLFNRIFLSAFSRKICNIILSIKSVARSRNIGWV